MTHPGRFHEHSQARLEVFRRFFPLKGVRLVHGALAEPFTIRIIEYRVGNRSVALVGDPTGRQSIRGHMPRERNAAPAHYTYL
jgi:hypothetical protein